MLWEQAAGGVQAVGEQAAGGQAAAPPAEPALLVRAALLLELRVGPEGTGAGGADPSMTNNPAAARPLGLPVGVVALQPLSHPASPPTASPPTAPPAPPSRLLSHRRSHRPPRLLAVSTEMFTPAAGQGAAGQGAADQGAAGAPPLPGRRAGVVELRLPTARAVFIVDLASCSVLVCLDGHRDAVGAMCATPNGGLLTGGGKLDATCKVRPPSKLSSWQHA